jgi:hypothetical protein
MATWNRNISRGGTTMFKLPLIGVIFACSCFGAPAQGVTVNSGSPAVTLPSSAPFNTIGSASQPSRFETRLYNFGSSLPSASFAGLNFGPFYIRQFSATTIYLVTNFNSDTLGGNNGVFLSPCCGQFNDILVRAQRDVANSRWTLEICPTQTQNSAACVVSTSPITSIASSSWSGMQLNLSTGYSVGFLRWFSTAVPLGTTIPVGAAVPDIADWEFQGNLVDQVHGLKFSGGSVSYSPRPGFPPVCNPGAQTAFRAGFAGTLDASGSYPLDGGNSVSYDWRQVSGPVTLTWNGPRTAKPGITGMVFGTYVFQLRVTDSSGQTSTCTLKDGAVATDNNNVVITGNSLVDTLLGPMVRLGTNPWPWFDNRHIAAGNVQTANLDTYYKAYWNTPSPGTITVISGSTTVTGQGTAFTSTFCGGPGAPAAPNGTAIIVWYPIPATHQTGRRILPVASCQSDNRLTLSSPWNTVAAGSNLNYSIGNGSTAWEYNAAPANYYDNVAGLYALYYRSGIDDYLTAARTLADRFWTSPQIDRGEACNSAADFYGCFPARSLSMMGLVLRARELQGTPADMWPGLHIIWTSFMQLYLDNLDVKWGPGLWDTREVAYHLAMVSYCALADPDTGYRTACKTSINNSFASIWTPSMFPDGGWGQFYSSLTSWGTNSSVTLTNGSTSVTGTGTAWTSGAFPNGSSIWFIPNPSVQPLNNSQGDAAIYRPAFVDATHLTLDKPYAGTTGTHGYVVSDLNYGQVGWAIEPFMEGILGIAFDLAAKGIEDRYPATAARAHSYNVSAANWIRNVGYWPLTKGLYYWAESMNCQPPVSDTNMACTAGEDIAGSRVLSAEALRTVMAAYTYSHDPALLAFGDTLYSAMWSRPGTGGPNPDGHYIDAMDDSGFYMTGTPPIGKAPKYFGMFFGFTALSAWPGARIGGLQPSSSKPIAMGFRLSDIPAAASAQIQMTLPSGASTTVACAGSPCTVDSDGRQGNPLLQLQFLSAAGNVVAAAQPTVIQ